MGGPWEDYKKPEATKETMPWEDHAAKTPAPSDVRKERLLTDYIPDENTAAALLSGFNQGALLDYAPNVAAMADPMNYIEARDRAQQGYSQIQKTNPLATMYGKTAGALMPMGKLAQGGGKLAQMVGLEKFLEAARLPLEGEKYAAQMARLSAQGAGIGALMNPGNTAGEISPLQLAQRKDNAITGAVLSPLIGTGVQAIAELPQLPGAMRSLAEKLAYKSSGPQLSNKLVDQATGRDKEIGRYMLENGLVDYGGTTAGVAKKSEQMLGETEQKLNQLYAKADDLFAKAETKPGFDPIRDKAKLMAQAKAELGMTEGGDTALRRLSDYIDVRAREHGDLPNQIAMSGYKKQVSDYAKEYKEYLKNKKAYNAAVGSAGDDAAQPVLSGTADDLQRTVKKNLQVELGGKEPSIATQEPYEPWTQQDLFPISQRPPEVFNQPKGEDLLPLRQQMGFDENFIKEMDKRAFQAKIFGLQNTPKKYTSAELPSIVAEEGQTSMIFPPNAPTRPVRPEEVRNPMMPSELRRMKTAMDERVKYSRNPQLPEPAVEQAFYGGRTFANEALNKQLEQLAPGQDLLGLLKELNKSYGLEKNISDYANKREARDVVNKGLSLTDWMVGPHSVPALVAKKTGEKFGYQTGARALEDLGIAGQGLSNKLNLDFNLGALKNIPPEIINNMTLRYLLLNPNKGE